MNAFLSWLDDRTGYRSLVREALYERVPGGARWRYVWGSTLVTTFFVQMVTGFFLWAAYSANARGAWESVFYIQHEMQGGWLLRGIHHFTAQAMVVLLVLHLMQVVIDGAYRAPREVNFWIGLILMQVVLGLSLTGYLLPWDQKGFWATKVATNIMGITPVIGPDLQKLVVGGTDYGHHTLTRFFAIHAGLLPALLIGLLVVHIYVFRRHGLTAHRPDAARDAALLARSSFAGRGCVVGRVCRCFAVGVAATAARRATRSRTRCACESFRPVRRRPSGVVLLVSVSVSEVLPRRVGSDWRSGDSRGSHVCFVPDANSRPLATGASV